VQAVRTGAAHEARFASFADGHRTTLLIEAILASHRTGSWVSV
jgi:predicted dehydrogenase